MQRETDEGGWKHCAIRKSHGTAQLRFMQSLGGSGTEVGNETRDRILNFMSENELLDWAAYLRDTQGRTAGSVEK